MRLLRAETIRLFKRRFTRYMLLIAVVILGVIATGAYVSHEKTTPAQIAVAQHKADQQYERQKHFAERERQECESQRQAGTLDKNRYPMACEELGAPERSSFNPEWYMTPQFSFRKSFGDMISSFAAILALVAFLIGASYVGAEWASGGMMNLLVWRPRRLVVLFSKLGALVGGLLGATAVLAGLWTATCWLIATQRGTTAKLTAGVWQSFGLTGLRALALILVAGIVGFAVASIGRHTAMALGGVLATVVVGQFGLAIVLNLAKVHFAERWLVTSYVIAWLKTEYVLEDFRSCAFSAGECKPAVLTITWQHSAWLFGVSALVFLVIAAWTMRRRDVN